MLLRASSCSDSLAMRSLASSRARSLQAIGGNHFRHHAKFLCSAASMTASSRRRSARNRCLDLPAVGENHRNDSGRIRSFHIRVYPNFASGAASVKSQSVAMPQTAGEAAGLGGRSAWRSFTAAIIGRGKLKGVAAFWRCDANLPDFAGDCFAMAGEHV